MSIWDRVIESEKAARAEQEFTPSPEIMEGQSALLQQLMSQIQGTGPSFAQDIAQNLFREGVGRAQRGAMSTAASARGVSPGMAARIGSMTGAEATSGAGAQSAALAAQIRMQELFQAQQLMRALTGQMHGQEFAPWQEMTRGRFGIEAVEAGKTPWYEALPEKILGGVGTGIGTTATKHFLG
jgi:hypothetical protein